VAASLFEKSVRMAFAIDAAGIISASAATKSRLSSGYGALSLMLLLRIIWCL